MASLAQKIQCEAKARELLVREGMPMPDEVEYGFGCIRLFFHEPKTVLIIDIDDYTEVDERMGKRAEAAQAEPPGADESRGPPFWTFPYPEPIERN